MALSVICPSLILERIPMKKEIVTAFTWLMDWYLVMRDWVVEAIMLQLLGTARNRTHNF
jgi:hypothetical protein